MKPLDGYQVEAEAGRAVALALELDDELRREGLAREIVHAVQNARRESGLEVTDRIELTPGGRRGAAGRRSRPRGIRGRRDARHLGRPTTAPRRRPRRSRGASCGSRVERSGLRRPAISIDAVIFDLDGVLIDSEPAWASVREQLTRESGGRWHEGAQEEMMGMSSERVVALHALRARRADGAGRDLGRRGRGSSRAATGATSRCCPTRSRRCARSPSAGRWRSPPRPTGR